MNEKVRRVLDNKGDNYIFPFFWQHGEDEVTLREYMQKIDEAHMKAVCVESRPHPDFCGPQWWHDMDIILDEAVKRDMKVWILDDSHFPTGYANGAMDRQPDELCRQSLCCRSYDCAGGQPVHLERDVLEHPQPFEPTMFDLYIGEKNPRKFDDDRLAGVIAALKDPDTGAVTWKDLTGYIHDGELTWTGDAHAWKVYVLHLSRNFGYHRSYINMMSRPSCRVLIDAVYEPHYVHYKDLFGTTIAGFFSDEPELGNGHIFAQDNVLGRTPDLPWSLELELALKERLGGSYLQDLALLFENDASQEQAARARYAYMAAVTTLVKQDFSQQLGSWCRERGVRYIGHLIEDNNQHARTGSSLGHYFRGLAGQDMAGIDDIGNQVIPQGEDLDTVDARFTFRSRMGEFYHYMLGTLGASAAAIEPAKHGDSMCEIFGAYGWSEGVRLEKYLIDHFLVRGINHFVPHAFSPMAYPDPDCPPHFYAHGHNPQYRHFGSLMAYTNRACELIHGGRHIAGAAVLYHGEAEWTGKCMFSHKVGHVLMDAQINYDYVPQDVFKCRGDYRTYIGDGALRVNTQEYQVLFVPEAQFVTAAFARAVPEMLAAGVKVCFINGYPEGICDLGPEDAAAACETLLLSGMRQAAVISLADVVSEAKSSGACELELSPENNRIRYYHYEYADGDGVYMFVNEGTEVWQGRVRLADDRHGYFYDAWENACHPAYYDGSELSLELEPLKSLFFVLESAQSSEPERKPALSELIRNNAVAVIKLTSGWKRSICKSIDYPHFGDATMIDLPDALADEASTFSGFVRYETTFTADDAQGVLLEITDAHEGVEVFVNGQSLGIQVVPIYRYDLSGAVKPGENQLVIEVATTLEREMSQVPDGFGQLQQPTSKSGITGAVKLSIQ